MTMLFNFEHKTNYYCNIVALKMKRNTIPTSKVMSCISDSAVALSPSDIHKKLGQNFDRVTVYRVIERLLTEGFIHKIIDPNGGVKYAKCQNCRELHAHSHPHFSCEICHQVSCVAQESISFSGLSGYQIKEVYLTIQGICPSCSKVS